MEHDNKDDLTAEEMDEIENALVRWIGWPGLIMYVVLVIREAWKPFF